jgi:hypothetical protein
MSSPENANPYNNDRTIAPQLGPRLRNAGIGCRIAMFSGAEWRRAVASRSIRRSLACNGAMSEIEPAQRFTVENSGAK